MKKNLVIAIFVFAFSLVFAGCGVLPEIPSRCEKYTNTADFEPCVYDEGAYKIKEDAELAAAQAINHAGLDVLVKEQQSIALEEAQRHALLTNPGTVVIKCDIVVSGDLISTAVNRALAKKIVEGEKEGNYSSMGIFPISGSKPSYYGLGYLNSVKNTIYPGDEVCVATSVGLLQTHKP